MENLGLLNGNLKGDVVVTLQFDIMNVIVVALLIMAAIFFSNAAVKLIR